MKKVKIHIRSFLNLHVYVAKVNKQSLPKLQPQLIFNLKCLKWIVLQSHPPSCFKATLCGEGYTARGSKPRDRGFDSRWELPTNLKGKVVWKYKVIGYIWPRNRGLLKNAFLIGKKVTFKSWPCPSQNQYRNEIEFRCVNNREDFIDTSVIKIGS
jgi:hypothetical protein